MTREAPLFTSTLNTSLNVLMEVLSLEPVRPDGCIIFQYLAIYMNENLPNVVKKLSKKVKKYAKY